MLHSSTSATKGFPVDGGSLTVILEKDRVPSRELTYPIPSHFLKMIFLFHPLPNMGYVRSLEGSWVGSV